MQLFIVKRMTPWGVYLVAFAALVVLAGQSGAQGQAPAAKGKGGGTALAKGDPRGGPYLVSPEVLADRRVNLRLYAAPAQEVRVMFEGAERTSGAPIGGANLTKGENGVWAVTVGPLDPGAYRYNFVVDGAAVIDPRNLESERIQVTTYSTLYVPGAAFMETKSVPHGAIAEVTYNSKVLEKVRRFHVYTPPGYEMNQQKYPVLYLLHGATESDVSWSRMGRAGFILDNLIADGKAVPMIVVMPNGHINQDSPFGERPPAATGPPMSRELSDFPTEFMTDILPYVESHYRTIPDRAHRAIAGLSMGGSQTMNIAFANLDRFSAIGVFSSGILGGGAADWEKSHLTALDDPRLKKGLKLIWFRTGVDDNLIANSKGTVAMLNKHGFSATFKESTGAHTWANWRNYLNEFAPQLFR
jgi:enterochelin esterase-like enzyme